MTEILQSRHKISFSLLAVMLGTFLFATFPAWQSLFHAWLNSDDYSHGLFIIPVSLFITWNMRDRLKGLETTGSFWGIIIVLFSLAVFIVASIAEILTLRSLAIIPLIAGIILYLWGFHVLRALLFPLCLLFFMIPVPAQIYSSLTIPLQLFVSKIAVAMAKLFNVPVFRQGNIIEIADKSLQVVRACSGMRSIMSLLTLSAVFGYLTLQSNRARFLLFLSGIPIALLVNIFRVFAIIIAFQYFNLDLTHGTYHVALGMGVFVIALAMLFLFKGMFSSCLITSTQN